MGCRYGRKWRKWRGQWWKWWKWEAFKEKEEQEEQEEQELQVGVGGFFVPSVYNIGIRDTNGTPYHLIRRPSLMSIIRGKKVEEAAKVEME